MKRSIKLEGTDIELVISKAVQLKVPLPFMYLWELNDGTWKLEYSQSFLPAFTVLDELDFQWRAEPFRKQPLLDIAIRLNDGIVDDSEKVNELLCVDRIVGISGHRGVRFIQLENRDNKWKLSYWKSVIPDITQVKAMKIVRQD